MRLSCGSAIKRNPLDYGNPGGVRQSLPRVFRTAKEPITALRGSVNPPKLALYHRDVALAKAPLPPFLKGRDDVPARKLVDRVRTEIEQKSDLTRIQQNVIFFGHLPVQKTLFWFCESERELVTRRPDPSQVYPRNERMTSRFSPPRHPKAPASDADRVQLSRPDQIIVPRPGHHDAGKKAGENPHAQRDRKALDRSCAELKQNQPRHEGRN